MMPVRTKITYTKELPAAAASVRYYAFRSREVERSQVGIFDRSSDHADVKKFIKALDDPLTRNRPGVPARFQPPKMHRLLFTMSGQEFRRWGLTSWKPIVREALENIERRRGIRLNWVAAEHPSLKHPHCHIAIKSVYEDAQGQRHRLKITPTMRQEIWQEAQKIVDRHKERALTLEQAGRTTDQLARGFLSVITQSSRQAQLQHEYERELQREQDRRGGG